jgi:hypothetical protein
MDGAEWARSDVFAALSIVLSIAALLVSAVAAYGTIWQAKIAHRAYVAAQETRAPAIELIAVKPFLKNSAHVTIQMVNRHPIGIHFFRIESRTPLVFIERDALQLVTKKSLIIAAILPGVDGGGSVRHAERFFLSWDDEPGVDPREFVELFCWYSFSNNRMNVADIPITIPVAQTTAKIPKPRIA